MTAAVGRLRQGAKTIGKQLTSMGSLGPILLFLFNNRNEFGDLLDKSIGRKDIWTKFGPQKSKLVGCWNASNLEDRSEGRFFCQTMVGMREMDGRRFLC